MKKKSYTARIVENINKQIEKKKQIKKKKTFNNKYTQFRSLMRLRKQSKQISFVFNEKLCRVYHQMHIGTATDALVVLKHSQKQRNKKMN